jgi:hypothetical protein
MALDRLTQITSSGISSTAPLTGINITGVITATSITAPNYGDVNSTALNVSGVSTFQASSFWGDGDIAYFGDGQDLLIFHNSTDSIIRDNGTGDLFIEGGNRIKMTNPTGIETYAVFNQDGAVELWYDNSKKLETTGSGVTVTGTAYATAFSGDGSALTGIAGTANVRTNSLVVSGMTTATGGIQVGATTSITIGQSFIRNNIVGLGTTSTTGRNAGVGTATGSLIFNSSTGTGQVYTGTAWVDFGASILFSASGGSESTVSRPGFKVHTFTSPGTFTISQGFKNVEVLVVAGGGGGGARHAGGGGAGGYRSASNFPMAPGSYTVTVGSGGAGGLPSSTGAAQGNPSSMGSIVATGGGKGGQWYDPDGSNPGGQGGPGGSGGAGANAPSTTPGSGNAGGNDPRCNPISEGNNGGNSGPASGNWAAGGGGGAGANGNPKVSNDQGGAGGAGLSSSIDGSSTTRGGGGGGGGGSSPTSQGAGGSGGGGAGGGGDSPGNPGSNGTANTGGGGGGSRNNAGGAGGSGIVIIAYEL